MLMNILAVGDIVGEPGLRHLERHLRPLQKLKKIDFTVVNGENADFLRVSKLSHPESDAIFGCCTDISGSGHVPIANLRKNNGGKYFFGAYKTTANFVCLDGHAASWGEAEFCKETSLEYIANNDKSTNPTLYYMKPDKTVGSYSIDY